MNKKKSVFKSRLLSLVLYTGAGLLLGVLAPALAAFIADNKLSVEAVREGVLLLSNLAFIPLFLLGLVFFRTASKAEQAYQLADMDDDGAVDQLYTKLYRNMEYAVLAGNIMAVLALFNLFLGSRFLLLAQGSEMSFTIYGFAELLLLAIFETRLFKLIEAVRHYKLSLFSTVSEIKAYVNSYDEGERQANLEQSFVILFNLNQKILPLLYLVLFAISIVSQTQQLVAYLLLAFIHIYINLSQYRMIKDYFK